jgi:hypothetical protein
MITFRKSNKKFTRPSGQLLWVKQEKKYPILRAVKGGEEYPTSNEKKEGLTGLVTFCVGAAFWNTLLEDKYNEG